MARDEHRDHFPELELELDRPTSSWTEDSNFTDSAVDVDATTTTTPPPFKGLTLEEEMAHSPSSSLSPNPTSHSLADRIRRLATATWALERDDEISDLKREHIESKLNSLEAAIEHDLDFDLNLTVAEPDQMQQQADTDTETERKTVNTQLVIDQTELVQIHAHLAQTVSDMRLRHQEQTHLHHLTATKLETIAQRYLVQEQHIQTLSRDLDELRRENRLLGHENDRLRTQVDAVRAEVARRDVAVNAMTSAVAGLEGWIDDSEDTNSKKNRDPDDDDDDPDSPLPRAPVSRRQQQQRHRAVVRGKGRFRGRYYYVDDGAQGEEGGYLADAQDLQDGVRAWIRGFRDVEDACNVPTSSPRPRPPPPQKHVNGFGRGGTAEEDDWGEFESPAR